MSAIPLRSWLLVSMLAPLALPLASCGGATAGTTVFAQQTFTFRCEIDGAATSFRRVEGLKFGVKVLEFNPGNGNPPSKIPNGPEFVTFALKRTYVGKPANEPILDWMRATLDGQNVRKNVSIIILSRVGTQLGRYDFIDCFPTAYSLTPLDADSDTECEETVELCASKSSDYLK